MKKEHIRCLKRIIAAALVLLTVSSAVPAQPIAQTFSTAITASAATITDSGEFDNGVKWTLDSDGTLTVSGNGEIPEEAFLDYTEIQTVVIDKGITSIGDWAFGHCSNLTSITIPKNVTSIGGDTFYGCESITDVYCYADPEELNWSDFEGDDFNEDGSTLCHVLPQYLEAYTKNFAEVNVIFVPLIDLNTLNTDAATNITASQDGNVLTNNAFVPNEEIIVTADHSLVFKQGDDFISSEPEIANGTYTYTLTAEQTNGDITVLDEFVVDNDGKLTKYNGNPETLVDLKIPDNVKVIGSGVFYNFDSDATGYVGDTFAKLETVDLNNVEIVQGNAFAFCGNITTVKGKKLKKISGMWGLMTGTAKLRTITMRSGSSYDDSFIAVQGVASAAEPGSYLYLVVRKGDDGNKFEYAIFNHTIIVEEGVEPYTNPTIEAEQVQKGAIPCALVYIKNIDDENKTVVVSKNEKNIAGFEIGKSIIIDGESYEIIGNLDITDESLQDSSIQIFDKVGGDEIKVNDGKSYVENGYVIFSDRELSFDGAEVSKYTKKNEYYRYTIEDIETEQIKVTHAPKYVYKNSDDESQLLAKDNAIIGNDTWKIVAGLSVNGVDDNNEVVYGNEYTPVVKDQDGKELTDAVITYAVKGTNSYSENKPSDKGEYTAQAAVKIGVNYYLKKDFVITAKDISDCTVSATPDGKVYDGSEVTPVVEVKDGEKVLEAGKDYTVTITPETNAGEYTITVTGIGNYTGTNSDVWSISKANMPELTIEGDTEKTYDGVAYSEKNITVKGVPSDFNPSYSYVYKSGSDTLTSAPSDAGDYKVVVTVKDNDGNYNDVVLEHSFKIVKRTVEIFPEEGQSKVYGQPDPTLTFDVEAAKENSVTGLVEGDSNDIFNNALALENDYDGTVGFWNIVLNDNFAADNYVVSYTEPVQLEVTPKQITAGFFELDSDSFVYSGKKNTVKINSFADNDDDSAVLTENDFDTSGTFSAYTPGSYNVEIKGQGNYTGTAYLNWTIAPNTDISAATVAENYTYDGTAHKVSVTANDDKTLPKNSEITYEYYAVETNEEGEIVSETKLDAAPVNAGYYKVQGVVTARGYEVEVAPAYFTISKQQIAVTVNADDLTSVYDSEEKEIGYTYDDALIVDGDDVEVSGTITVVGDHTDVKYDDEGNIAGYDIDLSGLTISSSNYELVLPDNVKYFVTPRDIEDSDIILTTPSVARPDKGYAEVDFKVVVNGKELVKGTDFDTAGTSKSGSVGEYTVQVEGIGNYSGIALADWSIVETNDDKDAAIAAIEEATTLTISDAKPTVNVNGVGRVTATVTREVADGFTIESTGFIYIKDAESDVALTLENVGKDGVSKVVGTNTNGSKTLNITDPNGSGARMVGYITVTDGTYSKTIYTDEVKATYEGLVDAQRDAALAAIEEATTISITDPIATVNASGVGRVTSKVTREVADGFTIEETGIIYIKDASSTRELTLENVGTDGVAKVTSANTNGSTTLNVTDPNGDGARMVGYVTVSDGSYSKTIYTNEVSGRYPDLK